MLFTSALVWLATGALTFVLPAKAAAYVILFQGMVSMPVGLFLLPRILGLPPLPKNHPMIGLMIQCAMVQTFALPAAILMFSVKTAYMPAVFATLVGSHFLPYAWIQRIPAYWALTAVVSLAPFVAVIALRENSFHYVSFIVGAALLVFSLLIRKAAQSPRRA
jgi:hypothetical protein